MVGLDPKTLAGEINNVAKLVPVIVSFAFVAVRNRDAATD
jgi:hypothetical protein